MIELIIFGVIFLIITEVIYILACRTETKKTIKREWVNNKIMSIVCSLFITFLLVIGYIMILLIKQYIKDIIYYLTWTLGIIGLIVSFFYINYRIGIKVANVKKRRSWSINR